MKKSLFINDKLTPYTIKFICTKGKIAVYMTNHCKRDGMTGAMNLKKSDIKRLVNWLGKD
jgi:hypothetical protein